MVAVNSQLRRDTEVQRHQVFGVSESFLPSLSTISMVIWSRGDLRGRTLINYFHPLFEPEDVSSGDGSDAATSGTYQGEGLDGIFSTMTLDPEPRYLVYQYLCLGVGSMREFLFQQVHSRRFSISRSSSASAEDDPKWIVTTLRRSWSIWWRNYLPGAGQYVGCR